MLMAKNTSQSNLKNLNFMNLKKQEYSMLLGLLFSLVFLLSVITVAKNELTNTLKFATLSKGGSPNNLAAILSIVFVLYGLTKSKRMWHQISITLSLGILFAAYSVYLFALS